MRYFRFRRNKLYCEDVEVERMADKFGTPLYIYSQRSFIDRFREIKRAFSKLNPLICYSVKANSNLSILKTLVKEGAGLDIVSGGELFRAKKVNCPAGRIVYASVGKTEEEIRDALDYGIFMFNVESESELKKIDSVSGMAKRKVKVSLRVNPGIKPDTHAYITTGKKENKFGISIEKAKKIFLKKVKYKNLDISGIHVHIGSQITDSAPFVKAVKKVKRLIVELARNKIKIKYFNLGGGLGIVYYKEKPQTAKEFAKKIIPLIAGLKCGIILEPGRFIAGNSGILITKVLYLKDTPVKRFIIVDAAMNDLIRPALYGAYHNIAPLVSNRKPAARNQKRVDVVGPVCESGDFLGKDRIMSAEEGEYLAVLGAGAYGFSMSSNYNSRLRAAEVLIRGNKVYLVRKREVYKDLIHNEAVLSL